MTLGYANEQPLARIAFVFSALFWAGIVVVHVFPVVGGRIVNVVIIIGSLFFVGVCILNQLVGTSLLTDRFLLSSLHVRLRRVCQVRRPRQSENAN